jgi:hypothetical protein
VPMFLMEKDFSYCNPTIQVPKSSPPKVLSAAS